MLQLSTVASSFPNLVKTDGQGYQFVDYVELIPLLVKAIQELSAQVEELSGRSLGEPISMMPSRSEGTASTADNDAIKGKPRLYQNTPNPFTAQTEIRFSLPDDAKNAYIYIFDMTGKMQKQIPVDPSMQSVTVAGYELQAGIYLYSLVVGGQEIDTKRMILSK